MPACGARENSAKIGRTRRAGERLALRPRLRTGRFGGARGLGGARGGGKPGRTAALRARRWCGQPGGAGRGRGRGGIPASWWRSLAALPAAAGTLGHVLAQREFGGEATGGEPEHLGLAAQRGWSCGLGVRGGVGLRGPWDPAVVLVWTFLGSPSRVWGTNTRRPRWSFTYPALAQCTPGRS